jgi:hypothetical protein
VVQPVVDRLWGEAVELDRVAIAAPPPRDG